MENRRKPGCNKSGITLWYYTSFEISTWRGVQRDEYFVSFCGKRFLWEIKNEEWRSELVNPNIDRLCCDVADVFSKRNILGAACRQQQTAAGGAAHTALSKGCNKCLITPSFEYNPKGGHFFVFSQARNENLKGILIIVKWAP